MMAGTLRHAATALRAAMAALALCAAPAAQAQQCGTTPDSCLEAHPLPGCSDPECCTAVCTLMPECCAIGWDASCAALADSHCAGLCGASASGSCATAHANPACSDAACCNAVCAVDPSCCANSWDATCVFQAEFYCTTGPPVECGLTGQGPCIQVHATPGCSDAACCSTVCGIDPSCCTFSWDQFCVQFATQYCGGCSLTCPPDAVEEPEACSIRANDPCAGSGQAPTPMQPNRGVCGNLEGTLAEGAWDGDRDVYALTVADTDGDGKAKVTLNLSSTVPAFAALVPAGCPVSLPSTLVHVNAPNCVNVSAAACVPPGTYWVLVTAGTFGQPGSAAAIPCTAAARYLVKADVSQFGCSPACANAVGDCFEPHPTPGCSTESCCQLTCTTDPFCCSDGWDYDCARGAAFACGAPVPANDSCATPQQLRIGQVIEFTTIRATSEGPALPPSCDTGTGAVMGPDLWYWYDGERRGNVVVNTCGSATDLRLAVYSGTCGQLTLVACGSSSILCTPNTGARVSFNAVCGSSYLIRVGGENNQQGGRGRITLTAPGPVCPAFCPPDINRDGRVDGADLSALLGNWGLYGAGDLDLNGQVNGADLSILLGAWGICP